LGEKICQENFVSNKKVEKQNSDLTQQFKRKKMLSSSVLSYYQFRNFPRKSVCILYNTINISQYIVYSSYNINYIYMYIIILYMHVYAI